MLRLNPLPILGEVIPYVAYRCAICGNSSGPGMNENEAWSFWSPKIPEQSL